MARLLHIPCRGIYHTDFKEQAYCITGDDTVCRLLEEYIRWFYGLCDEIKVPSREYISILSERGYKTHSMSVFHRGIEPSVFFPRFDTRMKLEQHFNLPQHTINLLYVGRVSPEKNVVMVLDIFKKIQQKHANVAMIFAGNGPEPYFSEFKKRAHDIDNVYFLGRLHRKQLPDVYSGSDMLVFPSTTDTFGMVVLEAQACGLPAVVGDKGGPQEIIMDRKTGFICPVHDVDSWVSTISSIITMINVYPERYLEIRNAAREHAVATFDWKAVLNDLFGISRSVHEISPDEDPLPDDYMIMRPTV
jgi:glycosyltransferase involved in cell wall biosynthesis